MHLFFRKFKPEDIPEIVSLNHSIVEQWKHVKINSTNQSSPISFLEEAKFSELSMFERWSHGGYWNDETLCTFYYEHFKQIPGEIFLCLDVSGNVLCELEICWQENKQSKQIESRLMWIVTKPKFRKRGIATKLLSFSKKYLQKKNIKQITTWPEDETSLNFYLQFGFIKIFDFCTLDINIQNLRKYNQNISITHLTDNMLLKLVDENWIEIIGNVNIPKYDLQVIKFRDDLLNLIKEDIYKLGYHAKPILFAIGEVKIIYVKIYGIRMWINHCNPRNLPDIQEILHDTLSQYMLNRNERKTELIIPESFLDLFSLFDYKIKKREPNLKLDL